MGRTGSLPDGEVRHWGARGGQLRLVPKFKRHQQTGRDGCRGHSVVRSSCGHGRAAVVKSLMRGRLTLRPLIGAGLSSEAG